MSNWFVYTHIPTDLDLIEQEWREMGWLMFDESSNITPESGIWEGFTFKCTEVGK